MDVKNISNCLVRTWCKKTKCFIERTIPVIKEKPEEKFNAKKYASTSYKYKPGMGKEFYQTREWRSLRHDVLSSHGGECSLCGRSFRKHNVIIHVDHIKPRSKYPHLELERSNLQPLCEDCNIGKGSK